MNRIPLNRRLIGSKWVFKVKRDGRFHSHLCALGYSQVPGVDFTDNFAPVVKDVTLCLLFILWMMEGYEGAIADVETNTSAIDEMNRILHSFMA